MRTGCEIINSGFDAIFSSLGMVDAARLIRMYLSKTNPLSPYGRMKKPL